MKKRQKKWVSIWLTLLLLFSIATPVATAKQNGQPELDANKLAAMKDRLLQQKNDFKNKKINKSIDTKSNETIKVIVEFNEEPTAVQEHKAKKLKQTIQSSKNQEKKKNERANFKAHLAKKSVNAKFGKSFEKVFNGVALEVKASDVPKLAEDPNVKSIYENSKQSAIPTLPAEKNVPYMQDSAPFIGADQLWNLGYEGEGKKIGVIDTGIDYNHPDLKEAYKGGYDFVDNDADPFEGDNGSQVIKSSHGTHVSGTIAGRGTYENGGTRGIAPKSDLYVYRVLGPEGGWDEWVIAGIEKAVEDGMDVINLSLGNGVNEPDQPTSRAVNNAMLAGVVAVVANGNSGDAGYSTVGAPGTAALAISVGASYPPITTATYRAKASATEKDGKEYLLNWMMKWEPTPELIEPLMSAKEIVYLGFGQEKDFEGIDLTGKVALIKRGEAFFRDVNERAHQAGAVAVIFFNSDGVNEHINHPFPQEGPLPMFDMRGDEGRELIEKMTNQEVNTFTFTGEDIDVYPGDELASFSSKGPVIGSWDIKPDLVAPGVNIRSTIPGLEGQYGKAYDRYSGTSMAAPHIAGLAALILEAHPEMDVFDVKTSLMNTSKKISPYSGGGIYNVQQIGAGRVQPVNAVETPVLAQVHETANYTKDPLADTAEESVNHLTGSLNFGQMDWNETVSKTITLKNLTDQDVTYKVTNDFRYLYILGASGSTVYDPLNAILSLEKEEITVPAGGTIDLDVSMIMPDYANSGVYDGYIYLTPVSDEGKAIQLPYMAYRNPNLVNAISYLESNPKFLSLNGDGNNETTNLEYKYLLDTREANIYLFSETDWDVYGLVNSVYEGDELKKGVHTFNWDGSYLDFNTGEMNKVKSGLYYLFLEVQDEFENWHYVEIPYIVSNEPTDIIVDNETIDASGQKTVVTKENKLHGMITSTAVQIYRDFMFHVDYSYYWNLISMEYELYDTSNKLLSKGDVMTRKEYETPAKHLEYNLKDIFPNGESRLVLRIKDKAGNVNEQSFQVNYLQDTGVGFIGEKEVEIGKSYELTLQTNQVTDMVGAEYIVSYPSKSFSIEKIVPVEGFAAQELVVKKEGTFTDESGIEYTKVKVITDLRKNPHINKKPKKDMVGRTGNIPTGKLIFKANDVIQNIGNHLIKADPSTYTTMGLEQKPLLGSEKTIELFTQSGSISGMIKPEALLDANGNHRKDINYGDKEGTVLKVYRSSNGYGEEMAQSLSALDGYRESLNWILEKDGSFKITGLHPLETYDIVIDYRSHFTGVIRGVQPLKQENGKLVSANTEVDFGMLKAGDTYNENAYDQKVDIYDVANVARSLGVKAVNGKFTNFSHYIHDMDKDGQINERDLAFTIKNYELENHSQDGIAIGTPVNWPPFEWSPKISLKTEKTTVKKGDIIPVKVELSKSQKVYALQYGFTYDPSILELVGADGTAVTGGQLGEMFSGNTIQLKNKGVDNRIDFAATYKGDVTAELKDTGVVMTYYFKVLADTTGSTTLTWDPAHIKLFRESYGTISNEARKGLEDLSLTIEK